jgi:hypothetical protein
LTPFAPINLRSALAIKNQKAFSYLSFGSPSEHLKSEKTLFANLEQLRPFNRNFPICDLGRRRGWKSDIRSTPEAGNAKRDRMPVLLAEKDFEPWLSGEAGVELLKPAPNDLLQRWPVSKRVNSSKAAADDPTLIDRIDIKAA